MAIALHPASLSRHSRNCYSSARYPITPTSHSPAVNSGRFIRRRVVLVAVVGCILGAGVFTGGAVAERSITGQIEVPRTVTVQAGDTLWAIAHRLAPEGNVMALVDELVHLNGDRIVAGQQIRVP